MFFYPRFAVGFFYLRYRNVINDVSGQGYHNANFNATGETLKMTLLQMIKFVGNIQNVIIFYQVKPVRSGSAQQHFVIKNLIV